MNPTDSPHQDWQAEALWQVLTPLLPGISIEVLARTASTNSALLERVRQQTQQGSEARYGRRAHDMLPCLLVAEHQTHGRGRQGRAWLSSPGASLTFSLGLPMELSDWSGLSLAIGCAIADALEPAAALGGQALPRLQLKWPNDLWLDGRKLGGILIETVPAGAQRMAIIGVGLNIHSLAAAEDGHGSSAFNTGFAALEELDPSLDAPAVLARIAPAMARCLVDFPHGGFAGWLTAYARRDLTLGQAVSAGSLEGLSRGVSADGCLLLETAQGLQSVSAGEVSLRLSSPSSPSTLTT
ncbi:biotin--[acetyl-CoA-carboxylase] ligase [Paucibacter sp. DJ1R-11]|uniref:biotin--[acetyl-CoA-carboxylase] ligase n=1 Tax=Paucibacter sp. DJ1R-11 TaxID=2893556 RepID=UPI0021E4B607|nr:biotin--[acetyl-CoA-carboxylase] ligase [Paucibacter sp. DJ1R-11]MCV2362121.1 biotin--[acetyl-CoA-carboxylase] ligase [Paucibacter sp. DJ1R-11]